MKKCPYCGAEYSNDAVMCVFDQTPLEENHLAVEPKASPAIKHKIPMPLSIVSYFFFASGVLQIGLFATLRFCEIDRTPFSYIIFGILSLFISRGLRRCSSRWRVCALIIIWLGFIEISFTTILGFRHSAYVPTGTGYLVAYALEFLALIWFYRVLTRPYIRDLFFDEHNTAA
jgi:hypothetical protein